MNELGRLEDLPKDYLDDLSALNLVPLWPNLRAVLPPKVPTRKTQPSWWSYSALRPLLMKSGELAPMEKAERRVLVLANPGHGLESLKVSAAMYLGMQLLLPGEWAPSHRHTPNAVRMIVEGEGAYTTVRGELCPMERGDLIITPTGLWHEHEHAGSEPVVWLDVLDLPVVYFAEASYAIEGARQDVNPVHSNQSYLSGGVVPSPQFERLDSHYPMIRYPWAEVRQALVAMAEDQAGLESVQVAYVNPETGSDVQNNLGFYALMLRPGQTLVLPARSPATVFHQIEGAFTAEAEGSAFAFQNADTAVFPGYTRISLTNQSATAPAFIFIADESPLHRKLGVYENRG